MSHPSTLAPTSPAPTTLWNRNYIILLSGYIITLFGDGLISFAMSLYVLDLTGRADIFAGLLALFWIPMLFAPLAGVLVDRVQRTRIIAGVDYLNALTLFVMFFLFISGQDGMRSIPYIGISLFLFGCSNALTRPAVSASIPTIVPPDKLASANGYNSAVASLSQIITPIIGAILYAIMPFSQLIVVSASCFLLAAICESFLRIPFVKPAATGEKLLRTIGTDLAAGFRFIWEQRTILQFVLIALVLNLTISPFFGIGLPYILRTTMGLDEGLYGTGMSLIMVGGLVGALTIGFFSRWLKVVTFYRWILLFGLSLIPMSVALLPSMLTQTYTSFTLFIVSVMIGMFVISLINIFFQTYLQLRTPNHMLGKVSATLTTVSTCAIPLGQLIYGELFEYFGSARTIWPALILCAFTFALATAIYFIFRHSGEDEIVIPQKKSQQPAQPEEVTATS